MSSSGAALGGTASVVSGSAANSRWGAVPAGDGEASAGWGMETAAVDANGASSGKQEASGASGGGGGGGSWNQGKNFAAAGAQGVRGGTSGGGGGGDGWGKDARKNGLASGRSPSQQQERKQQYQGRGRHTTVSGPQANGASSGRGGMSGGRGAGGARQSNGTAAGSPTPASVGSAGGGRGRSSPARRESGGRGRGSGRSSTTGRGGRGQAAAGEAMMAMAAAGTPSSSLTANAKQWTGEAWEAANSATPRDGQDLTGVASSSVGNSVSLPATLTAAADGKTGVANGNAAAVPLFVPPGYTPPPVAAAKGSQLPSDQKSAVLHAQQQQLAAQVGAFQ